MLILETPRLLLRTFKESDTEPFQAMNRCNKVMEHFPKTLSDDETLALISKINQQQKEHGYSLYALERKDTREFIGFTGILQPNFKIPRFEPISLPVIEIGWRLDSHHWRQGFATEAACAVLSYARDTLKLKQLVSFTAKTNEPSQALMRKIGLKFDSEFMHPALNDDSPLKPHVLYIKTF